MAERTGRGRDWLEIISNVAIVVGLGLVLYELTQSKALAHAQLVDSRTNNLMSIHLALMGENPGATLARAECGAGGLDKIDAVALDAMYRAVTLHWYNLSRTAEIAGFDVNPEPVIRSQARQYFTSTPGRKWLTSWAQRRRDFPPIKRIVEIAMEAVKDEAGESIDCDMILAAE